MPVSSLREAEPSRHDAGDHREKRRDREGGDDKGASRSMRRSAAASSRPARRGTRQAPTAVRRRLSSIFQRPIERNRTVVAVAARIPAAPKNPGQQLPIAARPAVLAGRGDVVACRKLFDDLDVRDQSGPREDSLEEVVTEQRALGDPAGRAPLRTRRRRRCPCRCTSLPRTDPDRRRRRRTRTGPARLDS